MRDVSPSARNTDRREFGATSTGGPETVATSDIDIAASGQIPVVVNGKPEALAVGATVADVVRAWCPSPDGIAVACNREVVPRSEWAARPLAPSDRVEIVTAAAGG